MKISKNSNNLNNDKTALIQSMKPQLFIFLIQK